MPENQTTRTRTQGPGTEDPGTTFRLSASTTTTADTDRVWELVSDLSRSSQWSPECTGGEWVAGGPGRVGSVFRGENHREPEVVGWAPVVRGTWTTEMEVVAAEAQRTYRWAMRDGTGRTQDSVWAFDLQPAGSGGTVLTHHFWMGDLTEGMRGILAGMDDDKKARFFREWGAKVEDDLQATVERIRTLIEA